MRCLASQTNLKALVWAHGCSNPSSVQEELRRRGLQALVRARKVENGELFVGKKMKMAAGKFPKEAGEVEEVEMIIAHNGNHHTSQEDNADPVAVVALLKACSTKKDLLNGSRIHANILPSGLLEKNIYVGSVLVNMYAKCGALAKAQEVFDELPVRNAVSWNALIAGYAQHGLGDQAINCFEQMQLGGPSPDAVTFACILKACGSVGSLDKGQEIHAEIVKQGLFAKEIAVGTALVDMYAKCGALVKAQEVFDKLPVRDAVSWNALITGFAQHGHGKEAVNYFERMQLAGLHPSAVTFACILKACGSIGAVDKGQEIHEKVAREGLLEKNYILGTALVDMYAKCGALSKAQELFDKLPVQSVATWNALIGGYVQHGHEKEAIKCFERMQIAGLSPDAITFACILKACGNIGRSGDDKGKELHAEVVRQGFLEKSLVVGNALIDMYGKCGELAKAQEVFNELLVRDAISWNALIAGYAQHGNGEKAINSYEQMQAEGLSPSAITFACILKAYGSVGAVEKGREIHVKIVKEGLLEENSIVANALVDMYAKCGVLSKAEEVFDSLTNRDVVSWNVLMVGYAQLGKVAFVFDMYNKMLGGGTEPDLATFTILLNTCCHSGLSDEGQMYFESMTSHYGITPSLEHYSCIVDLFGRSGYLDKALAVVKEMPFSANAAIWNIVLGACRKWGNVKLGRLTFEHVVELDEMDSAAYISMSNIYVDAGMQEEADRIEALKAKKQAR